MPVAYDVLKQERSSNLSRVNSGCVLGAVGLPESVDG